MKSDEWLAAQFESDRQRLRAVAYRMLGSYSEAEDAVQDAWLRFAQVDASQVDNLGGWLTTVVARVCLDRLRWRTRRRSVTDGPWLEDVPVTDSGRNPAEQVLVAESVGAALLVVLDALSPAERIAFVLHDVLAVPFDTIAGVVDRTPDAAQAGDFVALLRLLDPEVVLRPDAMAERLGGMRHAVGADEVASTLAGGVQAARLGVVDGTAALVLDTPRSDPGRHRVYDQARCHRRSRRYR